MSKGFGKRLVMRLLLTILLTFTVLGTLGGSYAAYLLSSPKVCQQQLEEQAVAEKVHTSLSNYFNERYHTTAIPAEVYLDVITVDWIADKMQQQTAEEYERLNRGDVTAPTYEEQRIPELEEAITAFFEAYAEEIHYEKDTDYGRKLHETITTATNEIQSQLDAFHFSTMRDAGILQKVAGKQLYVWIIAAACAVLSIALTALLVLLERRGEWGVLYFPGCALLMNGVFLTLPCAWILGTQYFSGLAIKVPAVYAAFTGTMYHCTNVGLTTGIVLLILGLAGIVGSIVWKRKKTN